MLECPNPPARLFQGASQRTRERALLGNQRVARGEPAGPATLVDLGQRGAHRRRRREARAARREVTRYVGRAVDGQVLLVERDGRLPAAGFEWLVEGVNGPCHGIPVDIGQRCVGGANGPKGDLAAGERREAGDRVEQVALKRDLDRSRAVGQQLGGRLARVQPPLGRGWFVRKMRQHGPSRISAGRRTAHGVEDATVCVDEQEIAAPTHRFYNQVNLVLPICFVPLLTLQFEDALERRLPEAQDARMTKVFAGRECERRIVLDATCRQAGHLLDAAELGMYREQYAGTAGAGAKDLDREAQLVWKDQLLNPSVGEPRLQLLAHRGQREQVERHRPHMVRIAD